MPLTILTPENIPALTKARWGMYARNGAGKTTFLTTIPRELKTLVISADQENVRPLVGLPHIRIAKIRKWDDLQDVLDLVSHPKSGIDVLAFDTWSRVQELAMMKVAGYEALDPATQRKFIDRIPKIVSGWDGWGRVGSLCAEWMRYFNSLPIHVIYLLQEEEREQKYDADVQTGPRLTPTAAVAMKDALELIGRLYVEVDGREVSADPEGGSLPPIIDPKTLDPHNKTIDPNAREVRKLFIGKHERYFAKGNTRILGRVIENPTWESLAKSLTPETAAA